MIHSPDKMPAAGVRTVSGCWNSIGVRGDATCPKLQHCVHCRNCPVYTAAALTLLDADAPADYLAHWTQQVACADAPAQQDALSALIFRVGAEWLALPSRVVSEIADLRAIHPIPHRREGVLSGLTNIRGVLLACVSLHRVLGIESSAAKETGEQRVATARLLVLQRDAQRAVCPVDQIHGIECFGPLEQQPAPVTVAKAAAAYTRALLTWQHKSVGLLDDEILFDSIHRGLA